MKIVSAEISGFRAFNRRTRINFDGDIVLVVGVNGQGKTSLFDAIHWAITGQLSRLDDPKSIVSLYSDSGEARVEVTLTSDTGQTLVVTRRSDGQSGNLQVRHGTEVFHGDPAEYELLRRLWPAGLTASDPGHALNSALERGVYLQQDVLTGFLTADTDQQRFDSIGELMGIGRATELQVYLERSRNMWSRITNQRDSEAAVTEASLGRLEGQLRELTDTKPIVEIDADEWLSWWTKARAHGVSRSGIPRMNSSDAQAVIDLAMAELQAIQLSRERRGARLRELDSTLQALLPGITNLDALNRSSDEKALALASVQKILREVEHRAAEIRKRQIERRSERQELRVLAEVTLRHLGKRCPVCQQRFDIEATRLRLQDLIRTTSDTEDPFEPTPDVTAIAEHTRRAEHEASAASATLKEAQVQERIRTDGKERIRASLSELSIEVPSESNLSNAIESALQENSSVLQSISDTARRGERLALSLAWVGQLARRTELEREVNQRRRNLESFQREIQLRRRTGDLVSSIINGLRNASSELIADELNRLDSLIQRIYSAVDPHPEFRFASLVSHMQRGRGHIRAEIKDPPRGIRIDTPRSYLSSSQMNVLAVSVFLALNLGTPTLPLRVSILDDPLQSLDDLNLLGLIDLLKRIRQRRQLIIATHDSRFASLLMRKLRPVSESQRTIVVDLAGWSSDGPIVSQHDIVRDPVPIRIAAA